MNSINGVTTNHTRSGKKSEQILRTDSLQKGEEIFTEIKKSMPRHALFSCEKLLRYDSNENFSNNIMVQLDCDVEFTSVTKRTVW